MSLTKDTTAGCIDPELLAEAQATVDALCSARRSVVTAESCTGGLIAAALSCARQAGECLQGGFVVYSKDHKSVGVGVPGSWLAANGSVNRQVAICMAVGALARSRADIALSVTGVLGPNPDPDGNPAGLAYLAIARRDGPVRCVEESMADAHPDNVRRGLVRCGLALLRETC